MQKAGETKRIERFMYVVWIERNKTRETRKVQIVNKREWIVKNKAGKMGDTIERKSGLYKGRG